DDTVGRAQTAAHALADPPVAAPEVQRDRGVVVLGDREAHALATPAPRLAFGRAHQQRTDALPPSALDDDEARDVGMPARGVDRDAAQDRAVVFRDEHHAAAAIHHRGELRSVLAD